MKLAKKNLTKNYSKKVDEIFSAQWFRGLIKDVEKSLEKTNQFKSNSEMKKFIKNRFDALKFCKGAGKPAVSLYEEILFNKMFSKASEKSSKLSIFDLKGLLGIAGGFTFGGLGGASGVAAAKTASESNALKLLIGVGLKEVETIAQSGLNRLSPKQREALLRIVIGKIN